MKVLAVSHHFDRCEAHILAHLSTLGVEVEVIFHPEGRFGDVLKAAGIRVTPYEFSSRLSPSAIRWLRSNLRRSSPDLVHFFSNRALSNGLLALVGLPPRAIAYRGTIGHLSRWDPLSWMTYLSPRLSGVICVSRAVRDFMLTLGIPEHRCVAIHKGHDPEWYTPRTPQSPTSLGIPDGCIIVACVANMRPVKGVQFLIEAIEQLPHLAAVHLLLIGDDKNGAISHAVSMSSAADRIHLSGFLPHPPDLLHHGHIFVMPSIAREGLPKALLEAMSLSLTPIVSRVGGMPEVVTDGVNGLVVPPKDAKAIAEAIESLVKDPVRRESLGAAAAATIRRDFDYRTTAERTLSFYRSILK